ncbi:MAG: DUF4159 domain-containing protein, partial [Pirellulaceae bacterium]|nr:DUF4159 domain-containing protein [Pirellulaceae bacterium]
MRFLPSHLPVALTRVTMGYAALWLATVLVWRGGNWLSPWVIGGVLAAAVPISIAWIRWLRSPRWQGPVTVAAVASAIYPFWWQLAVFLAAVAGLAEIESSLQAVGLGGLFTLGLGWVVWGLENASRRIELARINETLRRGLPLAVSAAEHADEAPRGERIWNPLDPAAWYYGRQGRKLKQSTLALVSYAALFWMAVALVGQLGGCSEEYELPAGGGQQKTVAQTVKIQKVIRKKFIVNPFSSIKFEVPPIDEVKLQLEEATAHQYTIGYGEGDGAGFAGGTKAGKVRLIRLEYDGGDWDLNFGIGGDMNMLLEYGILTRQKVAEQTESRRVAQLANFPPDKSPPVVFITGQGNFSLSNNDVKVLREYLIDKHGMVFASSGSRHFHNQFLAAMNRVLPDVRPVPIPLDDQIHRVPFAVPF